MIVPEGFTKDKSISRLVCRLFKCVCLCVFLDSLISCMQECVCVCVCVFGHWTKKNRGRWRLLCWVNDYLKTTAVDEHTHEHTHMHTLSKKALKHLTFHLTSSAAKSFYWLSIFWPGPVQTNGLFVYELWLCFPVSIYRWPPRPQVRLCVMLACERFCAYLYWFPDKEKVVFDCLPVLMLNKGLTKASSS